MSAQTNVFMLRLEYITWVWFALITGSKVFTQTGILSSVCCIWCVAFGIVMIGRQSWPYHMSILYVISPLIAHNDLHDILC